MYSTVKGLREIVLLAIGLCGCHHADRVETTCFHRSAVAPNLALDPWSEANLAAVSLDRSSAWPSVDTGYRLDDVTTSTEVLFDYQTGFDRWGGIHRLGQTIRTGVFLR